jgi:hypothetical protein
VVFGGFVEVAVKSERLRADLGSFGVYELEHILLVSAGLRHGRPPLG